MCDPGYTACDNSMTDANGCECDIAAGNTCNAGVCCTPDTCTALGFGCGTHDDGCGGTVTCTCDTANGEICYDDQCWTLMAHTDIGPYSRSSAYWTGTLGSNVDFVFDGYTYNSGDLETTIRTQPFQYLKVFDSAGSERVDIAFSQSNTTFAEKLSVQESLTGGQWYPTFHGYWTHVEALLGRLGPLNIYGDRTITGLASYGYTWHSYNGECPQAANYVTFTVGYHGHRACYLVYDWYAIIR